MFRKQQGAHGAGTEQVGGAGWRRFAGGAEGQRQEKETGLEEHVPSKQRSECRGRRTLSSSAGAPRSPGPSVAQGPPQPLVFSVHSHVIREACDLLRKG